MPVSEKPEPAYLNPVIDVVINVLKKCILSQAGISMRINLTLSISLPRSELSKLARKYPIKLLRALVVCASAPEKLLRVATVISFLDRTCSDGGVDGA